MAAQDEDFAPALMATDWNEEWKRLQRMRDHADSAQVWDERAKTFSVKHGSQAGYVGAFLELASIRPGETVLDMGCGTGALATPLAQAGHHVIACDFSEGMLAVMHADQRELGITGVDVRLLGWQDDWDAQGIGEDAVDVALASRSIATYDLGEALMKLDRAARRRACITLPASVSPRADDELLTAAGLTDHIGHDFLYAFNILAARGCRPEVAYIPNTRREVFDSPDEALDVFTRIACSAVRGLAAEDKLAAVPGNLRAWLDRELVCGPDGYELRTPRTVTWAFVSWNTKRR